MDSAHSSNKLDLYSIPVFLLEIIVLIGLAFGAHYLHFQHKHEPYLTGFYCDDVSLRHEYLESTVTEQFRRPDNELTVLSLLLVVPIVMIIFCELINSMFGALKFRRIRALCKCCKLHSITRRTIRFSGAYMLGFLIVMISCDILANTTGKLKPYFAQECPNAFKTCPLLRYQPPLQQVSPTSSPLSSSLPPMSNFISADLSELHANNFSSNINSNNNNNDTSSMGPDEPSSRPLSQPIMNSNTNSPSSVNTMPPSTASRLTRNRRDLSVGGASVDPRRHLLERQWILLEGVDLARLCDFSGDSIQTRKFEQLAMSWPSFPAAIITYACLYLSCYLCFVGTARPVRIITSVLVIVLLLASVIFDVELVREHFCHWEDSLSGAALAGVVVLFVLFVYLNKFKDAHYYENQKLLSRRRGGGGGSNLDNATGQMGNAYSNEIALEQYSLDKADDDAPNHHQQGGVAGGNSGSSGATGDNGGSVPNNDLAMRYFQIPRANYRGAPRPLSNTSNNHHL